MARLWTCRALLRTGMDMKGAHGFSSAEHIRVVERVHGASVRASVRPAVQYRLACSSARPKRQISLDDRRWF